MLNKKDRLTRSRVEYILRKGHRQTSRHFSTRFLRGTGDSSRFAVVVSTRVAPKATDRNRLRRQIYEAVQQADPLESSLDIVLISKPSAKELTFKELLDTINSTLKKLHEENR